MIITIITAMDPTVSVSQKKSLPPVQQIVLESNNDATSLAGLLYSQAPNNAEDFLKLCSKVLQNICGETYKNPISMASTSDIGRRSTDSQVKLSNLKQLLQYVQTKHRLINEGQSINDEDNKLQNSVDVVEVKTQVGSISTRIIQEYEVMLLQIGWAILIQTNLNKTQSILESNIKTTFHNLLSQIYAVLDGKKDNIDRGMEKNDDNIESGIDKQDDKDRSLPGYIYRRLLELLWFIDQLSKVRKTLESELNPCDTEAISIMNLAYEMKQTWVNLTEDQQQMLETQLQLQRSTLQKDMQDMINNKYNEVLELINTHIKLYNNEQVMQKRELLARQLSLYLEELNIQKSQANNAKSKGKKNTIKNSSVPNHRPQTSLMDPGFNDQTKLTTTPLDQKLLGIIEHLDYTVFYVERMRETTENTLYIIRSLYILSENNVHVQEKHKIVDEFKRLLTIQSWFTQPLNIPQLEKEITENPIFKIEQKGKANKTPPMVNQTISRLMGEVCEESKTNLKKHSSKYPASHLQTLSLKAIELFHEINKQYVLKLGIAIYNLVIENMHTTTLRYISQKDKAMIDWYSKVLNEKPFVLQLHALIQERSLGDKFLPRFYEKCLTSQQNPTAPNVRSMLYTQLNEHAYVMDKILTEYKNARQLTGLTYKLLTNPPLPSKDDKWLVGMQSLDIYIVLDALGLGGPQKIHDHTGKLRHNPEQDILNYIIKHQDYKNLLKDLEPYGLRWECPKIKVITHTLDLKETEYNIQDNENNHKNNVKITTTYPEIVYAPNNIKDRSSTSK